MEDKDIVALYWARSERAVGETAAKYGGYCAAVIRRILGDRRDVEECLGDTWLGAWNAMPPHRPARLAPPPGAHRPEHRLRPVRLQRRPSPKRRLYGGFGGAGGVRGGRAHGGGF